MSNSNAKKNVVVGFGGQLIILLLGMIFPRIILKSYGSDANGLISTISQIFSYMALLEAGISQAAKNELYKHIVNNDQKNISIVTSTAERYFHKITLLYSVGVVLLSFLAPMLIKSSLSKETIFFAVFFEGMAGALSFYFVQTPYSILSAFGKDYVNNSVEVLNKGLSYLIRIVLALMGMRLFYLQLSYCVITLGRSFFYARYFKKHYGWINFKAGTGKEKLKDRNAYVVNELAWTIFSSTDSIILSTFIGTEIASVYAVYNMVFNALNSLLNAVYTSISYMLGQAFHQDLEIYEKLHDNFTSVFLGTMTILMSVSYVLIIPFIHLYTKDVADINYIYPSIPIFFCLIRIISWSRYITGNLTGIAGYAKQTSIISMIEACTNIIVSIILVHKFGVVGVLIGSTVALPIKVIYCAYITDKKILKRSLKKTVSIYGANYLFFVGVVILSRYIPVNIESYLDFTIAAVLISCVIGIFGIIINVLVNRDCAKWLISTILKR